MYIKAIVLHYWANIQKCYKTWSCNIWIYCMVVQQTQYHTDKLQIQIYLDYYLYNVKKLYIIWIKQKFQTQKYIYRYEYYN